jgi:hypothetical protein
VTVGVLDDRGLLRLLRAVEGRTLLAVLDCADAIELVFSEACQRPNLVTFYMDGRHRGLVSLGGVAHAERYAGDGRRLDEAA